jgi:hypothetical protein
MPFHRQAKRAARGVGKELLMRKRSFLATVAFLAVVMIAGCGSKEEPQQVTSSEPQGTVSSCDLTRDVGYCLEFTADAPKGTAQRNCDSAKQAAGYNGILAETALCSTLERVGTCSATISGIVTNYRYRSPKWTKQSAEANCSSLRPSAGIFIGD